MDLDNKLSIFLTFNAYRLSTAAAHCRTFSAGLRKIAKGIQ